MKKDKKITEVIFRNWGNDIIALFPYEIADFSGNVLSYMHIGQHGGADYNMIVNRSKLATEDEYKDLFNELENYVGYNLKVVKRRNYERYLKEYYKVRNS